VSEPAGAPGITVSGRGVARGAPDQARVRFGAAVRRPRLSDALDGANACVARLRRALEAHGVAREDVVTGWLNVWENQHEGAYHASHTLDVLLRDLDRVGDVLGGVLVAGGEGASLGGVQFEPADRAPLVTEARALAWADARGRAEQLAAAAGRRLGAVTGVVEVDPAYRPLGGGPRAMAAFAEAAPSDGAIDVEAGKVAVEVALTVTWGFA
jgi:uncharacterized protein YggE